MELVTVTCDRDFHQQILQSHSLDKFLDGKCTHWIIVEKSQFPIAYWEAELSKFYKRHTLKIIDGNIDFVAQHLPGYVRQQILKLAVSQFIKSEDYLILDSKDLLLRPTALDRWGEAEGSGTIYNPPDSAKTLKDVMGPEMQDHFPFAEMIEQFLGFKTPKWFWAPITPFRCKTDVVKKLVNTINLNQIFDNQITGVKQVSEFILYRYFSDFQPRFREFENIRWYNFANTRFLWPNKIMDDDIKILSNDFYKSISFHRWYIVNNGMRIRQITNFLIKTIELDPTYVANAFDIDYWNKATLKEIGHPIFEKFNLGFRNH
jgi:hypothetical protein